MYTLIHDRSVAELLSEHLPTVTASLIIAEMFYKFHSFLLESLAFLATWYVLGAAFRVTEKLLGRR